ncbi:uncharacterized protein [Fopius arisanus]|uniref:PC1_1686 protein n=1 Tax=Fopius arisanus TaxID=64838 RepID=A0A0C9R686_9HYME|nr:PREDICTED: uncharacterized protein LOC105272659 [Fopius arisanus]
MGLKMIIIILSILSCNLCRINAMAIPGGVLVASEIHAEPFEVILFEPGLRQPKESENREDGVTKSPLLQRSERMARSVLEKSSEDLDDDLETAAGTNVLRPLFVYRQQMAYRERSRKNGRRAAPTY